MTQPTALRLVEDLSYVAKYSDSEHWNTLAEAASELRRLHAENEALRGANNAFGQRQEWWNERMFVLEQQRDELLEALRLMLASHDATCPGEECQLSGVDLARAAIAKAQQ